MKQYRIIISGGGTGGHIFPAISIANTIKERFPDAEILFVGADDRMEMERVPAAGYQIIGLPISGFDRAKPFNNVKVLNKLAKSLRMAKKIIREFKPDIAIGVGGYASGPTLWAAASLGIPTLIQEQNSYAGVTNKLLARKARKICVAYDGMQKFFPAEKLILTGNPVRKDLLNETVKKLVTSENNSEASDFISEACKRKSEASHFFSLQSDKKTLLVLGGSLGARTINHSIWENLDKLNESGIQLIWQTGRFYYSEAKDHLEKYPDMPVRCSDFITRMDYAYSAADLVISRAGAGTISELCLLKKPAILVPSPNVAEDHQTKNAQALAIKDAAILVPDRETVRMLIPKALELINDEERLITLSRNISDFALADSADHIVDEIIKIIDNK